MDSAASGLLSARILDFWPDAGKARTASRVVTMVTYRNVIEASPERRNGMLFGPRTGGLCAAWPALSTSRVRLSPQNENVRFEQSRTVRFHGWPENPWKRSESP